MKQLLFDEWLTVGGEKTISYLAARTIKSVILVSPITPLY